MTFNENDIERHNDGKFAPKQGSESDVVLAADYDLSGSEEMTAAEMAEKMEQTYASPAKLLPSDLSDPAWNKHGREVKAALEWTFGAHKAGGYDQLSASGNVAEKRRKGELHNWSGPARVTFEDDGMGGTRPTEEYFVYGEKIDIDSAMFDKMEDEERRSLDAVGLPHQPSENEHPLNTVMRDGISNRAFTDVVLRETMKRARSIEEQRAGMSR